jgi:hypothetical protein
VTDPRPVLEYLTPDPKRPRAVLLTSVLAFAVAFEIAFATIWFFGAKDPLVPVLIFSSVATAATALILVVTTWARAGLTGRPLRPRGALLSIAVGVGCIAVPYLVRAMLLGVTETLPWALTTWFVGAIASSFVLHPAEPPV